MRLPIRSLSQDVDLSASSRARGGPVRLLVLESDSSTGTARGANIRPMPVRRLSTLLAVFALSCASTPRQAGSADADVHADVIHSDLPLFRGGEHVWPQPFGDEDAFGCVSRVAFGDWVFRDQHGEDSVWYRVQNYGVFHCWALLGRSSERRQLEGADLKPAFFVFLGKAEVEDDERELWVAQIGARPGSEYVLLARSPAEGPIEAFEVLQTRCPPSHVRDAGQLDILLTRYCALNTQADLVRLARQMAQLPAVGTLSLAPADSEPQ